MPLSYSPNAEQFLLLSACLIVYRHPPPLSHTHTQTHIWCNYPAGVGVTLKHSRHIIFVP